MEYQLNVQLDVQPVWTALSDLERIRRDLEWLTHPTCVASAAKLRDIERTLRVFAEDPSFQVEMAGSRDAQT